MKSIENASPTLDTLITAAVRRFSLTAEQVPSSIRVLKLCPRQQSVLLFCDSFQLHQAPLFVVVFLEAKSLRGAERNNPLKLLHLLNEKQRCHQSTNSNCTCYSC